MLPTCWMCVMCCICTMFGSPLPSRLDSCRMGSASRRSRRDTTSLHGLVFGDRLWVHHGLKKEAHFQILTAERERDHLPDSSAWAPLPFFDLKPHCTSQRFSLDLFVILDGQHCQSPNASIQRTQPTLAGQSSVPHGQKVARMSANRAIRPAAQRTQSL